MMQTENISESIMQGKNIYMNIGINIDRDINRIQYQLLLEYTRLCKIEL